MEPAAQGTNNDGDIEGFLGKDVGRAAQPTIGRDRTEALPIEIISPARHRVCRRKTTSKRQENNGSRSIKMKPDLSPHPWILQRQVELGLKA